MFMGFCLFGFGEALCNIVLVNSIQIQVITTSNEDQKTNLNYIILLIKPKVFDLKYFYASLLTSFL